MATNTETVSSIGLRVEGEGGQHIIKEEGDSDNESNHSDNGGIVSSAGSISQYLTPSAVAPVFGTVSVTDSQNVHFGDKHIKIFNGPVSIKQIVQPNEASVNNSYSKTDDENIDLNKRKFKEDVSSVHHLKEVKIKLKHMLTFGLVAILLLATIFIIVFVTQSKDSNTDFTIDKTIDYAKPNATEELLISPHHLRIVSRTDWLAQSAEGPLDKIRQPIPWVIIAHSASESCFIQSACVKAVRNIQMFHIESNHWFDIGYNFLVGGDGSVYVGRGWDAIGAHTKGYNKYSIGIAFIGTFNKESPTKPQVDACRKLIIFGVQEGKLSKDYKVFGHRQLMSSLSPGDKVFDIISEWPHFVKEYTSDLIPNY